MRSSTKLKSLFVLLVIFIAILIVTLCITLNDKPKHKFQTYENNGNVMLNANIDDFRSIGIDYGDELEIEFSSGYKAQHVPLYTSDFGIAGTHVLYGENQDMTFQLSHEDNTWNVANLNNNHDMYIKCITKGKYKNVQKAFSKGYKQESRELIQNRLYRGLEKYLIDVDNATVENGVDALNLKAVDIKKNECNDKIIAALFRIPSEGKIYISTTYPTDFFVAIVEAIAGFSYQEIADDYMKAFPYLSYEEYRDTKKYTIDAFLHKFTKTEEDYDMNQCDMKYCAERYLRSNGVSTKDVALIFHQLNSEPCQ